MRHRKGCHLVVLGEGEGHDSRGSFGNHVWFEEGCPFPWWFPSASRGFGRQNREHPHINPLSSRRRITRFTGGWYPRVLNKHAAQLSEQITVFSEPKDEDLYAFVESPQLTSSALKKFLQLVNVLVHYVFEVNHFMNKCLKFMHKIEVMIASCMAVCEDMRKPAKKSKVTSFNLLSLPSPCTLLFSPSDNFWPETHHSKKHQHIYLCLVIIYLHILRFCVLWYL